MTELPDLSQLRHNKKDALIRILWAQVQALTARVAELEARLGTSPKAPDNSSLPLWQGKKPNRAAKAPRHSPRPGSLGRMGGGRALAENPDEIVVARPARCVHCQAALAEADHVLHERWDKIDLPQVAPVVTRVERYAGRCRCCGATTLAAGAGGLGAGHAVQRRHRGFGHVSALRARDQLPAAEPAIGGGVRLGDQRGRGGRRAGRAPPGALGARPPRRAAGPCRRVADLLGPSTP